MVRRAQHQSASAAADIEQALPLLQLRQVLRQKKMLVILEYACLPGPLK